MIERAPEFEIGVVISESGSLFNHLLLKVQFFMSFVPFMLFLFRLLERQASIGALRVTPKRQRRPAYRLHLSTA